jgi:hypothetical protein
MPILLFQASGLPAISAQLEIKYYFMIFMLSFFAPFSNFRIFMETTETISETIKTSETFYSELF